MASIESYDPSRSGGKPESSVRLIPPTSGVEFDWTMFDMFLQLHVSQWPNGVFCLVTDLEKLDIDNETSDEDKVAREKKLRASNTKVMGALYNVSFSCDEAKAVLTAHNQADPEKNAFKLYKLLKERFSKKNNDKLQGMINELMSIMANAGEEPTELVDRFEKMCVAIKSIDSAQLPTDLQLVGVLKKAISLRFKTLNSGIKLSTTEWTLELLKKKLREWKMENEILTQQSQNQEKAHFTPAGRGRAPNLFNNREQQRDQRFRKAGD